MAATLSMRNRNSKPSLDRLPSAALSISTHNMAAASSSSSLNTPIDNTPVPAASALNRAGQASNSLYQKCLTVQQLYARVQGFPELFLDPDAPFAHRQTEEEEASGPLPNDPVSAVCRTLRLGASLCYLFNALGLDCQLDVNKDANRSNISACKKGTAQFIMAAKRELHWDDSEMFIIRQLYDQDTTGTVQVVDCVLRLLNLLESRGSLLPPLDSGQNTSVGSQKLDMRGQVVREILETERKHVQDLEILQAYKNQLRDSNIISQDTSHAIFLNLDGLVDFQRRFLIGVEAHAVQPPESQRFGHLFISMEDAFAVYEPYCVNFALVTDLLLEYHEDLRKLEHVIEPNYELPTFLIKPIHRLMKYPLLMQQLVKSTDQSSPYLAELQEGLASIQRVTNRVNEAKRRKENELAVIELRNRVEDWKQHEITSFGNLMLEDTFNVIKNDSEREYHVYLFERIILCCKDVGQPSKKNSKSNSMLRKPAAKKSGPLQLKGRIFTNNVQRAEPMQGNNGSYLLKVTWTGEPGHEHFSLKCRSDEQQGQWKKGIESAMTIARNRPRGQSMASNASVRRSAASQSPHSQFPNTPLSELGTPLFFPSAAHESYLAGHTSMPPHARHDSAYDGASIYGDHDASNGRATPSSHRRGAGTQSLPATSRESLSRPRAGTDDSNSAIHNWRSQTPSSALPSLPRGASMSSNTSDGSSSQQSGLRSSTSSRMLKHKQSHEWGSAGFGRTSTPGPQEEFQLDDHRQNLLRNASQASLPLCNTSQPPQQPPPLRNRSASSPHVYQLPQGVNASVPGVPPLNIMTRSKGNLSSATIHSSASASTVDEDRRRISQSSIGSHRSSGDSMASQPQSYYTNATSPAGMPSAAQLPYLSGRSLPNGDPVAMRVKLKVGTDSYVIVVLNSITYVELVDKVLKKTRNDPNVGLNEHNIKLRYEDEEGDKISISSDEDILLAFEGAKPSVQSSTPSLTIFVD